MQIGYGKNQVGNGGSVPGSLDFDIAPDRLYVHLAFKVPRLYPEAVIGKLPEIKTQPDHYRKLGMHAGEIPGDDSIKGPYNSELPGIFLGKITKGKEFYLHYTKV
jgi:hypothetical protein